MDKYCFQNCQKIVILNQENTHTLLAKRQAEVDYDGVFAFVGGKMETTDQDIIAGLKREKDEELGISCQLKIYPKLSHNVYFQKKDGAKMILPHYYAQYIGGEIKLSSEYSEYQWIKNTDLAAFEPKIPNITEIVNLFLGIQDKMDINDFIII